nr:uncharacterized protein LOC127348034 [Lolium perenne]
MFVCSGQLVNREKSSVFFSPNTPAHVRQTVKLIIGISVEAFTERYLGLPTAVGRITSGSFDYIAERIRAKIQGCERMLACAGREVFLKTVIQAIPLYSMSCFKLTKKVCKSFSSITGRYWWSSSLDRKSVHWVSWKELAKPKVKGGMGFRDLELYNVALLGKHGWRLMTNPSSLCARVLKVWKLNVVPIVRVFWWRVLRGIFPVESILKHRHIAEIARCKICLDADEDLMHALVQCSHAKKFWEEEKIWLKITLPRLHPQTWSKDILCDPQFTESDRAKIITGGAGGVARTTTAFLVAWSKPYEGLTDPLTAEALAMRDGVIFARLRGFTRVVLEVDCLETVNLWNTRHGARSAVTPILSEIGELSSVFISFVVKHLEEPINKYDIL